MTQASETLPIRNPSSLQELVVFQEWPLGADYKIKLVQRFEEPTFRNLVHEFFYKTMPGWNWEKLLSENEKEQCHSLKKQFGFPNSIRLAVYHADRFIGWTYGWQDTENSFYMASSAVLPDYQRQGIYSAVLDQLIQLCREKGFQIIRSRHVATNNPVIISKLKAGFMITGMELHDAFGTLVQLSFFTNPKREKLLKVRSGLTSSDADTAAICK